MTELQQLLDRAAGPHAVTTTADLEADVARGMRALRRRRTGLAGGALTVAVAAAAIPVAVSGGVPRAGGGVAPGGAGSRPSPSARSSLSSAEAQSQKQKSATAARIAADNAAKRAAEQVSLGRAQQEWLPGGAAVPIHTYAGPQLAGSYQPGLMPEGTVVQGGSAYRLTIARAGDPDTDPDSFIGKIVVMLSGRTAPNGTEVQDSDEFSKVVVVPLDQPVDGATAFEVQYPPGLGWTDDEAVKFASSVTVRPDALTSKG